MRNVGGRFRDRRNRCGQPLSPQRGVGIRDLRLSVFCLWALRSLLKLNIKCRLARLSRVIRISAGFSRIWSVQSLFYIYGHDWTELSCESMKNV